MKDTILYNNLGLSPNLSNEEIKKEGKKLLLKWHPDKNENKEESSKRFIEVKEILDILCDSEKRLLYHQIGISILHNKENQDNKNYNNNNNKENYNNKEKKHNIPDFNTFQNFNNLFGNLSKIINNMNINNIQENNQNKIYDTDVTHIIKIDYQFLDPEIDSIFHIVYKIYKYEEKNGVCILCNICNNTGKINDIESKNCTHVFYREEYKKIIITISAEKILNIIEKKQNIIMKGQGNILKNKKTDLIIIFED